MTRSEEDILQKVDFLIFFLLYLKLSRNKDIPDLISCFALLKRIITIQVSPSPLDTRVLILLVPLLHDGIGLTHPTFIATSSVLPLSLPQQ